jgi:hypothetical protein
MLNALVIGISGICVLPGQDVEFGIFFIIWRQENNRGRNM